MTNNTAPPGKPFVYAFSSGRLVLLVCMVLLLILFSFMLGIRTERHQQRASTYVAHAPRPVETPSSVSQEPVKAVPKTEPASMETPKTAPAPPEKTTEVKQGTVSEAEKPLSSPKPKGISPPPEKKAATPAPQPPPEKKVVAPAPKPSPPKQVAPEPAKTEPEKAPPPPKKIEEDVRLHYAIQVASSQDKRLAESHKDLLNNKGFTSYIEVINLESRGTFYRVMVGPFRTKTEAENVRGQLIRDSRFADCYVRYLP